MPRTRSPNFPAIDLERALGYARKLYEKAQRHPMPIADLVEDLWGLSPTSSTAKQAVAALRAFGLIEIEGSGEKRSAKVSEDAFKILNNHSDSQKLLRAAALLPKINRAAWEECGGDDGLAPDQTIRHYLLFDHEPRFNEASIASFIRQLKATLSFAGVISSGTMPESEGDETDPAESGKSYSRDGIRAGKTTPGARFAPSTLARSEVKHGMNQNILDLEEGVVMLQYPKEISQESYEDLKAWLGLMVIRVKRAVTTGELEGTPTDPPETI